MKPAIRSIRCAFWPVLLFASGVCVSACSRDSQNEESPRRPLGSVTTQDFIPSQESAPEPLPTRWLGLIGEYGPDDDVWLALEDESRLHLRQGEVAYALEEASADEFLRRRPDPDGAERVLFTRRGDGRAAGFQLGEVYFPRREVGTVGGQTFRIDPLRDVEELRIEALAATPPVEEGPFRESELVDLTLLDPTIELDIRYAGTNNFMNAVFYEDSRAFLQRPGADAVVRAHRALVGYGYGLLIHDGYRPWYVTKMFWDATPTHQREFVANPASGSRHNRGAAVDLSLYDLATGEAIEMPSSYDEFSHRSYPDYPGGTAKQRWHRDLLR
ncbi:MAG: M15 family metallopeptidase, partial [Gemmatimonadota bacterium]|nr:M15 family metallopeptidase [Gemmatimonadota bacterium]